MKKALSIILACTLAFSLTACGGTNTSTSSKDSAKKSGKLTIWAWDPNFNIPVMNKAKELYTKDNPDVKVEVVTMSKSDVEQKLQTMLQSGVKDGLPDVVLVEDYNAQKYLTAYPGSFADLTKSINYGDFAKYKQSLMTVDNKVYGVPFDSGVAGLFYRSDLLEKAGYKASDLNNITWDQFIEIGKQVKAKTGVDMIASQKSDGGIIRIMLQSAGSWYFDEKGNVNIANNDALKEACETYKKLYDAGIVKDTTDWNTWVASFNKGEAASICTGIWIIGSIKAEKSQSGKWAVAPVPKLNNSKSVNYSNLGGSSWYVLNNSQNKSVAIDFMKKMFDGNNDLYQKILTDQGAFGTYIPAQTGTAYSATDDYFGGQKVFSDMSGWMKNIPTANYGKYTYEADAAVMAAMSDFYKGKITSDQLLTKAEAQVKSQIK